MNWKKATPVIISVLYFGLSAAYTPAQKQGWDKDLSAAIDARQRGEYTVAEMSYKRAIEGQEKALGQNSLDVAISLNNLAVLYQDEYMYAQAEPLYKRAIAI